jgi:hypothetical protein
LITLSKIASSKVKKLIANMVVDLFVNSTYVVLRMEIKVCGGWGKVR